MITNVRGESSDNYAVFIDGYEEEPIKDIHIENFHVEKAVFPYYIKHGDNIKLKDTTINNEVVPESPKESKKRKTLDVY